MSGIKGRSGRRLSQSTLIARSIQLAERNVEAVMQGIIDRALAGDKDCLMYLADRVLGRPSQALDVKSVQINVTGEEYRRILDAAFAQDDAARLLLQTATVTPVEP